MDFSIHARAKAAEKAYTKALYRKKASRYGQHTDPELRALRAEKVAADEAWRLHIRETRQLRGSTIDLVGSEPDAGTLMVEESGAGQFLYLECEGGTFELASQERQTLLRWIRANFPQDWCAVADK